MYALVVNNSISEYPISRSAVVRRLAESNISVGAGVENLEEYGYFQVTKTAQDAGDVVTEDTPVLVQGEWTQAWATRSYTVEEIEQQAVENALTAHAQELRDDQQATRTNPDVLALLNARPAQIDTYIDNNVTDMSSAKEVLKILAKAIAVNYRS
jgi:hypothetical protein